MKAVNFLLLVLPFAVAAHYGGDQAVFNAGDFLSDSKQAILDGKQDLDKWMHDGKEFIKQNHLLCERLRFLAMKILKYVQMNSFRILPSSSIS